MSKYNYSCGSAQKNSNSSGLLAARLADCPQWAADIEPDNVKRANWFFGLDFNRMENHPKIVRIVVKSWENSQRNTITADWLIKNYLMQIVEKAREIMGADIEGVMISPEIEKPDYYAWAIRCGLKSRDKMVTPSQLNNLLESMARHQRIKNSTLHQAAQEWQPVIRQCAAAGIKISSIPLDMTPHEASTWVMAQQDSAKVTANGIRSCGIV